MILTCPSCGARFNVSAELLGPGGRNVRCGDCGHSWHQNPEAPEPAPEIRVEPAAARDRFEQQRQRARTRRPVITSEPKGSSQTLGWALLGVFVLVVLGGALAGRDQVVAVAPATAAFYEMLGFQGEEGLGLDLRDVTSERRVVDGERTLVIQGVIVNTTDQPREVPQLRASLTDGAGQILTNWTFAADSADLPPGGFTTFETSAVNPPSEGRLNLVFLE